MNVLRLFIPSLRDRVEDISSLVDHFLKITSEEIGLPKTKQFSESALKRLESHSWPGNVRELKNTIVRLVIDSSGSTITRDAVELDIARSSITPKVDTSDISSHTSLPEVQLARPQDQPFISFKVNEIVDLKTAENSFKKFYIEYVLENYEGNKTRAAQLLKISTHTINNILER